MIATIAWREFRTLFVSPLAWTVLGVVQFLLAFEFLAQLEQFQLIQPRLLGIDGAPGVTDLVGVPTLATAASLLLLVVPLLTMRLVAGERQAGTLALLRSSPVSAFEIVFGKYLGLVALLAVLIAAVALMPASLALGTTPDWGKLASATLGLALLTAAFAAAGVYFSTLARQPLVAAIATFGFLLLLWMVDVAGNAAQRFTDVVSYASLVRHYQPLLRGTFASADVVYYLLFIALFLGLAVRRLDAETAPQGWRLRVQGWTFVALFAALLATGAWLSTQYQFAADWTAGNRNTLSEVSRTVARSFDGPVTITAFVRGEGPLRAQVAGLVARYERENDAIRVAFVNPDLEPARTRAAGIEHEGEMTVEHDGHLEHVLTADERSLTQALQRVARGAERLLAFTSGHGERDPLGDANHDYGVFGAALARQGVRAQPLNPLATGGVPDGTSALVVTRPRAQLVPGALDAVLAYVDDGGNLLLLADPEPLNGLEPLLERLGVALGDDAVRDPAAQMFGIQDPRLVVVTEYPRHPATAELAVVTLFPEAAAVTPAADAAGWAAVPLLSTVTGQAIGLALTRGDQRVAVIGDADFLANAYLNNGGNLDLGVGLVDWVVADDEQVSITLQSAPDLALTMPRTAYVALAATFLLGLPLLSVGAGVLVWWRRRRR